MYKEEILNEITKSGKLTYKNILNKFNIGHHELDRILLELKLDGKILQVGNKYSLFPPDMYIGNILVSTSGKKYIMCNHEKISLASDFFNDIILNDTVSFKINEQNEAEIYTIINRELGKMTCEVKIINGKKTIVPFHNGLKIKLPSNIMDKLLDGDIILVNIDPNEEYMTYLETIGKRDDPLIEDKTIALNYGFDNNYDDLYMNEVAKLPTKVSDEEVINRVDYRHQTSFTIDGIYTKDMDDGVYAEMLDNNVIRVYVHIADVSHYIKPGSKIYERACDKTTSLYMNNSVFHMLHHIISNGICSLNENSDRLAKTVVMDIDKNGNIIGYDIQKSVINSHKKMTYNDVDEIIMNNNMIDGYKSFEKTLYILYDAAIRLEKRYVYDNGKINFANTELSITYNDDGTIESVQNAENSISRKIIENLMIAANESVANWFINIDMPTVYRIHEFPNAEKIRMVIETLNKEGYHVKPINDYDNSKSLQRVLHSLSSYEEFPIISSMLVMAMQRARYSTINLGHYALGLPAYLHFTSPIRRLADLLVHQVIDLVLTEPEKITVEYLNELESKLKELSIRASQMERQAATAEAIGEKRSILKSLAKDRNHEYEAIILEIGKKIKIRVKGVDTYIDSKLLNKALGYDSKKKRYYRTDNGERIKIGSKLLVRIRSIDTINNSFNVDVIDLIETDIKRKTKKK